jgi:hypothetical protein
MCAGAAAEALERLRAEKDALLRQRAQRQQTVFTLDTAALQQVCWAIFRDTCFRR